MAPQEKRDILFFTCRSCKKMFLLTRISLTRRKKICMHCGNSIRLYASSNKFGKIRKMVFNKYIEEAIALERGKTPGT
jgi:hypothetical protein